MLSKAQLIRNRKAFQLACQHDPALDSETLLRLAEVLAPSSVKKARQLVKDFPNMEESPFEHRLEVFKDLLDFEPDNPTNVSDGRYKLDAGTLHRVLKALNLPEEVEASFKGLLKQYPDFCPKGQRKGATR